MKKAKPESKPGKKIQELQAFPDKAWAAAQGFPNVKLWPKRCPKPRLLHWTAILMQKVERTYFPELTQNSTLKPGTHWARNVAVVTGKVPLEKLKDFEKQLGEILAKKALGMDQEFFTDFANALSSKSEERSAWLSPVRLFLINNSRKVDTFKTEDEVWEWATKQPEIAKLAVEKYDFTKLLKDAKFKETRGKS